MYLFHFIVIRTTCATGRRKVLAPQAPEEKHVVIYIMGAVAVVVVVLLLVVVLAIIVVVATMYSVFLVSPYSGVDAMCFIMCHRVRASFLSYLMNVWCFFDARSKIKVIM